MYDNRSSKGFTRKQDPVRTKCSHIDERRQSRRGSLRRCTTYEVKLCNPSRTSSSPSFARSLVSLVIPPPHPAFSVSFLSFCALSLVLLFGAYSFCDLSYPCFFLSFFYTAMTPRILIMRKTFPKLFETNSRNMVLRSKEIFP